METLFNRKSKFFSINTINAYNEGEQGMKIDKSKILKEKSKTDLLREKHNEKQKNISKLFSGLKESEINPVQKKEIYEKAKEKATNAQKEYTKKVSEINQVLQMQINALKNNKKSYIETEIKKQMNSEGVTGLSAESLLRNAMKDPQDPLYVKALQSVEKKISDATTKSQLNRDRALIRADKVNLNAISEKNKAYDVYKQHKSAKNVLDAYKLAQKKEADKKAKEMKANAALHEMISVRDQFDKDYPAAKKQVENLQKEKTSLNSKITDIKSNIKKIQATIDAASANDQHDITASLSKKIAENTKQLRGLEATFKNVDSKLTLAIQKQSKLKNDYQLKINKLS